MRIIPTRISFAPDGPPPSFRIETDGRRFFAVQVATEAALLNGALASRRSRANFFDSFAGDIPIAGRGGQPIPPEVQGRILEAVTGATTYALPPEVWGRLRRASQLFYRLLVSNDRRLRRPAVTTADVDAGRAPSVSIARLPAQPARAPVGRFRGRGAMRRTDFAEVAAQQLRQAGMIQGRDGDFRFVVLDGDRFETIVVECHEEGLTDTVELMSRKPAAVINGQFLSGAVGIATEGEVIREGRRINADSRPTRFYLGQTWSGGNISSYRVGQGNPSAAEPGARIAFGGLGPVLMGGTPTSGMTPWARDIYNRPAGTGRGVIAVHRRHRLVLLLVQEDSALFSDNAMTMPALRQWLQDRGFDDAVFNDGSDSEALYASGGWLLTPAFLKNEAMDFAIGFVDGRQTNRFSTLAIDGTASADGVTVARGLARPPTTHFAPRNIVADLATQGTLAPIASTFRNGIIEAGRADQPAQAALIGQIIRNAGAGGRWADLLYVSSHAWRPGQLWYHRGGGNTGPIRMLADVWAPDFRVAWRNTPRWLIIAGCAVLGLRVTRGLELDANERTDLVTWHRNIHGSAATIPGLTQQKRTLFASYHPGWAWYSRAFRSSGVRGVLGYWYRSPGGGRDAEIVESFVAQVSAGRPLLEAWQRANERAWFEASAAWAAMVRRSCEADTLATLENLTLGAVGEPFLYYDEFQTGREVPEAYAWANRLTERTTLGAVRLQHHPNYDEFAVEEFGRVSPAPTGANLLVYDDGVGP